MGYSKIKKVLSAVLLVAFTAPSTLALTTIDNVASTKQSMLLTGDVNLTEINNNITLSLRDSDVKQVLRMFADKAGMNIVFHNSVNGKVTLDLVDVPVNEAFKLVLQIAGLNYYKQGNTLIVMGKDSPDNASYSKQEMMVFPVNYVSAGKIADFLNKNVFSIKRPGISSVDAATVNSATNELIVFGMENDRAIVEKVIAQFDREPYSRTFIVNHTTPAEMAKMICEVLLPSGGIGASISGDESSGMEQDNSDEGKATGFAADASGEGGEGGEGGGSSSEGSSTIKIGEGIVACSIASGMPTKSVAPFDVQNLSIAYFPQRGTITMMGGSQAQANMIEKFIKTHDTKQPQALLEVSILELNEQGSKEFQNRWNFNSNGWGFNFDGSSTSGGRLSSGAGGGYIDEVNYVWNGPEGKKDPYLQDGKIVVPQQVVQIGKVPMPATTYISWQMNYLIENKKARILANPKILITNGQESLIDLTQDYVEKVTSEYLTSSSAGGGSMGTAQRTYTIGEDLGIKVTLTPFISPEGYVTLNIKPEYSTIANEVRTLSEVTGATDLAATLLSRRDLDLKNVRIKDGETLVIGGLIQETEQKTVQKIPFFGDLPLIGSAFRSTSTSKSKNELVIMITPRILNDDVTVADNV